ncbi:hypothetical protein ACFVS2_25380 [Brevibacillus sp. NPDC058079]|uniref:hypothetical protein n=1 Tax=Brevibacillus sp. NPDC058079 TaxID=3346330 RepID=UPI0036E8791F
MSAKDSSFENRKEIKDTKKQIKKIGIRILKIIFVIALIKWVRMEIKTDPALHAGLNALIETGKGQELIQLSAVTIMALGLLCLGVGFWMKKVSFLESKLFLFVFTFVILDGILLYSFPELPLLLLR